MSMANFRERLRGDRGFRDRFLEEVLIMIAVSSGMVDAETGQLRDDLAQRRIMQPRVQIAGRPLRHYYGQTDESLDRMGLTAEEKAEVKRYLNIGEAGEQQHVALGYNWPTEAPAPPADVPMADEQGREHPSLVAWRESQEAKLPEPDPQAQGQTGAEPSKDAPPIPEAVVTRSATPDNPTPAPAPEGDQGEGAAPEGEGKTSRARK